MEIGREHKKKLHVVSLAERRKALRRQPKGKAAPERASVHKKALRSTSTERWWRETEATAACRQLR